MWFCLGNTGIRMKGKQYVHKQKSRVMGVDIGQKNAKMSEIFTLCVQM